MGRFAHLLTQDVFTTNAPIGNSRILVPSCSGPDICSTATEQCQFQTVVITSPLVHRVPKQPPASANKENEYIREESYGPTELEAGLATQQLFQQMLDPLIDLQIVDDEEEDEHAELGTINQREEEQKDFFSVREQRGDFNDGIEAEFILQSGLQNSNAAVPFELGLGQILSAYTIERFSGASEEEISDKEEDTSSLNSSDDTLSVASCLNGLENGEALPETGQFCDDIENVVRMSTSSTVGPRVVAVSPWTKRRTTRTRPSHEEEFDLPQLTTEIKPSCMPLAPALHMNQELHCGVATIQEAMMKSEQLFQQQDILIQKTTNKSCRTAPHAVHPSIDRSTVGLMLWRSNNQELIITGFERDSHASRSGLILGDAVVEVNNESVTNLQEPQVSQKLVGITGTTLSLCVSRIISNVKTYHMFNLTRDISLRNMGENEQLPANSHQASANVAHKSTDCSRHDPIIMAFRSKSPAASKCEPATGLSQDDLSIPSPVGDGAAIWQQQFGRQTSHSKDRDLFPDRDYRIWGVGTSTKMFSAGASPVVSSEGKQIRDCRFSQENQSVGSFQAASVPSPTGLACMQSVSVSPANRVGTEPAPPLLTTPQQLLFKLRRPLGQLQIESLMREEQVKTSPIAHLQISSPDQRSPHPMRHLSPQVSAAAYDALMKTSRKGVRAPSGAKPRRIKGDWKSFDFDENRAPPGSEVQIQVGSVKILRPVPPKLSMSTSANSGFSPSNNRAPLNCVRSVGTMAQPHIVDHTRLHLDFVAEIPIVAAYQDRVPMVSVGVQCQSTEERSEIHYDEDVVLLKVRETAGQHRVLRMHALNALNQLKLSMQTHSQNLKVNAQKRNSDAKLWIKAQSSVTDVISSISAILSPHAPAHAHNNPLKECVALREKQQSGSGRDFAAGGGARWKFPMGTAKQCVDHHRRMLPREIKSQPGQHGGLNAQIPWMHPPQRRRFANSLYTQHEDLAVAELLNSTIPEMEIGC